MLLVTMVTALLSRYIFLVLAFALSLALQPAVPVFHYLFYLEGEICRLFNAKILRFSEEGDSASDLRQEQDEIPQIFLSSIEAAIDASYEVESCESLVNSFAILPESDNFRDILAIIQQ